MLWSRVLLLSAAALLSTQAFALTKAELDRKLCEQMLGITLISEKPQLKFDLMAGLGMRGFLGAYPDSTGDSEGQLAGQGLFHWGHSFAVRKTVEEAREHDKKLESLGFIGLAKIMYLISDVDVSDLTPQSPVETVRERFKKIMATGRMVYWDDSESILTNQKVEPKFVEVEMAVARRLLEPETIGFFDPDLKGPRFNQSGWMFSKIRGELQYKLVFESGSERIKKVLKDAKKLSSRGYTFTFNQNFQESLDAARDQIRVQKDEKTGKMAKAKPNSRYLDKEVYDKALAGYRAGQAFSVEVRDENGKLVGGVLGEKHGNKIALETVFYTYEEKSGGGFKSNIDMAKIAVVAALKRLHEHGIDIVDAGMVTVFTASMQGVYVSAEQFIRDMEMQNAMGNLNIDLSRPWIPE